MIDWERYRGLTLHLITTYVDRFPRESLLKTCSGVDNGVRGLSACSAISTLFYNSHLTRLSPSVPTDANAPHLKQKLQEASARKVWEDRSMDREARQRRSRERGGRSRVQHREQQGRSLLLLGLTSFESWENSYGDVHNSYLVQQGK